MFNLSEIGCSGGYHTECSGCGCDHHKSATHKEELNTMAWRCGRCEQAGLMLQGRDIGQRIPYHIRSCPLREVYPIQQEAPDTMTMPPEIAEMSKNAMEILHNRPYLQLGETVPEMWMRIASHVARAEKDDPVIWEGRFYNLMSSLSFIPNTPTVAYAGVPGDTHCLSACFVDSPDDTLADIVRVGTEVPFIESSGGGIGWGLSKLRPAGDKVGNKVSGACGPVNVLHWYSAGGKIFTQGIIRQGAHMAQLHVSHPDILEFIRCKDQCKTPQDPLANVNISVQLTDDFMEAVKNNAGVHFVNPRTQEWTGKIVPAQDIWDAIVESAWRTGDPGVVFMDRVHEAAPNPSLPPIQSSNPCGEEFLEDGGSCNLGSMNLTKYLRAKLQGHDTKAQLECVGTEVDWDRLAEDIYTAVRFLDDVIDVNVFPYEHLADMNKQTRRIGLGVMGWADMLVMLGLRYDSQEALDLAEQLATFITDKAWEASRVLAVEKGAYPLWQPRMGQTQATRNSSVTTIAPTGSISILANVSSGIEPHFDLMWTRKSIWTYDGGAMSTLVEMPTPLKQAVSERVHLTGDDLDTFILRQYEGRVIINHRFEWLVELLGHEVMNLYRPSHEVSPEYHVRMQAAWQAGKRTTNGVSKTINLPNSATVKDISDALMLAWELECKAVTVYRDGSKGEQVLDGMGITGTDRVQLPQNPREEVKGLSPDFRTRTQSIQDSIIAQAKKLSEDFGTPVSVDFTDPPIDKEDHNRPKTYQGETVQVQTGHGTWFFTVNRDPDGKVLEVFLIPTDNNACIRAGAVIIGRLLSMALRLGVPIETVIHQLDGIDCGHPVWEGGKLITSVYDALAKVLSDSDQAPIEFDGTSDSIRIPWQKIQGYRTHIESDGHGGADVVHEPIGGGEHIDQEYTGLVDNITGFPIGATCPACGQDAMVHRGGCLQCMSCGHNTCE